MTVRHFKILIQIIMEKINEKKLYFQTEYSTANSNIFGHVSMSFGSPLYLKKTAYN